MIKKRILEAPDYLKVKRIVIISFNVFIIALSCLHYSKFKIPDHVYPVPTKLLGEDERHEIKQAWIEDRHKTAPDDNWRQMDLVFRLQKAEKYAQYLNGKSSNSSGYQEVLIANGQLKGAWREIGSRNQAGRMVVSEYDTVNDYIYCASAGGNIWKRKINNNNKWICINDHFRIPQICMLRIVKNGNSNRIIVASKSGSTDGIFYSDDDGITWLVGYGLNTSSFGYVHTAVVTNDSIPLVYVLAHVINQSTMQTGSGLFLSTDQGTNFTQIAFYNNSVYGPTKNFNLWAPRYGSTYVYMQENSNIYIIANQSVLQLIGTIPFTSSEKVFLTGCVASPCTVLYSLVHNSGQSDFYRSTDFGMSWTLRGSINKGPFSLNSFTCSPTNPDVIYFGAMEAYRSYDGAVSWTKVNNWGAYYNNVCDSLHADIPGINVFLDSNGVEFTLIDSDGGVYISHDSLNSVQNLSMQNLNTSQYYSIYSCRYNPDIIHAGSQDQGYQYSFSDSSDVRDFYQVISGDFGQLASSNDGTSLWMEYPGSVYYYPDINNSTTRCSESFPFSHNVWIPPVAADPDDSTAIYVGGGYTTTSGAYLYRVQYSNAINDLVYNELPYDFSNNGNSKISAIAISPINSNYMYVITNNGEFYCSSNGGTSWSLKTNFNVYWGSYLYGSDILPSSVTLGKVYVCGSGYSNAGVYVSYDHGQSFNTCTTGLPGTLVNDLDANLDESMVFAATELGPYVYITADSSWYDMSEYIAPDQSYLSVEYIPAINSVRFGTYGRGIWEFKMCDTTNTYIAAGFNFSFQGTQVSFTNSSSGATSYYWDFGDSDTSTIKDPVHTYSSPGVYVVKHIASDFCSSDSTIQTIMVGSVGVNNNSPENVVIYPNPTKDKCFIQMPSKIKEDVNLDILSLDGKSICSRKYSVEDLKNQGINLGVYGKGIYVIRLYHEKGYYIKKVVVH